MIPFNIFGHSNTAGATDEPIVWVDSSDNSSYTLSGSDVTALFNKGTLGGAMTLNGSVKFANSGFESWSNNDYITRSLGEPFITTNSFTFVATFTHISESVYINKYWATMTNGNLGNDWVYIGKEARYYLRASIKSNPAISSVTDTQVSGVNTFIVSYNRDTTDYKLLGLSTKEATIPNMTSTQDSIIYLLNAWTLSGYSGVDTPLHEFRLYDRAFSLTEMQNLQTELNDKYTP